MTTSLSFGSASQLVVAYLLPTPGLGDVDIKMSPSPALPFVLVSQVQCRINRIWSKAEIDLDLFTNDPGDTIDFGRVLDDRMLCMQFTSVVVNGYPVAVGEVECDTAFSYRNYEDPQLHRAMATYSIKTYFNAQPL